MDGQECPSYMGCGQSPREGETVVDFRKELALYSVLVSPC